MRSRRHALRPITAATFAAVGLAGLHALASPPSIAARNGRIPAAILSTPSSAVCSRPAFVTPFEGPLGVRAAYRSSRAAPFRYCPAWSTFGGERVGRKPHGGVDIAATTGTLVRSATDGSLTYARDPSGYGYYARVTFAEAARAPGGTCEPGDEVQIVYAHLVDDARGPLPAARVIKAGEVIGRVGCTGNARGMCSPSPESHLHVTVQRAGHGARLEPTDYLGWQVAVPGDDDRPAGWQRCN